MKWMLPVEVVAGRYLAGMAKMAAVAFTLGLAMLGTVIRGYG